MGRRSNHPADSDPEDDDDDDGQVNKAQDSKGKDDRSFGRHESQAIDPSLPCSVGS